MRAATALLTLLVLGQALLGLAPGLCFRQGRLCHVYWATVLDDGASDHGENHACTSLAPPPPRVPFLHACAHHAPTACALEHRHESCRDLTASWGALLNRCSGLPALATVHLPLAACPLALPPREEPHPPLPPPALPTPSPLALSQRLVV